VYGKTDAWVFDLNFTFANSLKENAMLAMKLNRYHNLTMFPYNNT